MDGTARTFNSQYDATGNRTVLSSPSNYYASFAYDALGRMSAYKEGTTTVVGFEYDSAGRRSALRFGDANGNLKSVATATDGSTAYVYDSENRLVSASGAWNATLAYDPLGRLWQISSAAGTKRFVYDGDRLVEEYDGAGNRPRTYVHGQGADEPLVWYEWTGGPVHRFYHSDHQGSIVALADDDGDAMAINTYDPWGIPKAGAVGNMGRFQYTGQQWIAELGLYYYKARLYSPGLGRFLQTDPIGYDDQINLYAYVQNDPINLADPTGKCSSIKDGGIRTDCLEKRAAAVEDAKAYLDPKSVRSGRDEAAYIATYDETSGDVTVRVDDQAGIRTNIEVVFTDAEGNQLSAQRDGRIIETVNGQKQRSSEIVLVTGHSHPKENPGGGAASRALDQANDNIRSNQNDRTLSAIAPAVIKGTTGTIRVYINGKEVK